MINILKILRRIIMGASIKEACRNKYDSLAKKILNNFDNIDIPVDIADLAKKFGMCPLVTDSDVDIAYELTTRKVFMETGRCLDENIDDYLFFILMKNQNGLENRVFVAYCIAHMYLKMINNDFSDLTLEFSREIPKWNEIKKLALCLLCPYEDTIHIFDKKESISLISEDDILTYSEKFLVKPEDFIRRLSIFQEEDQRIEQ